MLIENWIAVMIIVFFFLGFMVLAIGGILNDQRLEDERKKIDVLQEENKALREEVVRLNSKISFAKLYVDMEGRK